MKKLLSHSILRWYLPRFRKNSSAFNRLLAEVLDLLANRLSEEAFRLKLDNFFRTLNVDNIKAELDFEKKREKLDRPGGYKVDVSYLIENQKPYTKPGRFDFWGRRFGLLRHLKFQSDVIILREGEIVPPHGHHRVISGFYVLEGRVAIRHFDRIKESEGAVLVRKVIDTELDIGGYTTNSEFYHNIHWLQGLAEKSYLFRITVKDTPTETFGGVKTTNSRLYLDPTGEPDESGLIQAPYISDSDAKKLFIRSPVHV